MRCTLHNSFEIIEQHIEPGPGRQWLDTAFKKLENANDLIYELSIVNTIAQRKSGHGKLEKSPCFLETGMGSIDISQWEKGDAARILLTLKAIDLDRPNGSRVVKELYSLGDEGEKAALIKGLILYSQDDALKLIALEAGRTNSVLLFESLATNNPYPAAYYSEPEFNQLVLKALFIDVGINYVYGLTEKANPELSRMCEDYIEERLLANRTLPADIWLALGPYASLAAEKLMIEYSRHPEQSNQYYAIVALIGRIEHNADLYKIIDSRLADEQDNELANEQINELSELLKTRLTKL